MSGVRGAADPRAGEPSRPHHWPPLYSTSSTCNQNHPRGALYLGAKPHVTRGGVEWRATASSWPGPLSDIDRLRPVEADPAARVPTTAERFAVGGDLAGWAVR
ncbi:hypothetical protein GCM10027614_26460 [Micromonospora vulcania]